MPKRFLDSFLYFQLSNGRDAHFHLRKTRWFQFPHQKRSFLNSIIPFSPAYGVFISQLMRYIRACSSYECFILRTRRLSSNLRFKSLFRKLYARYGDLVQQYEVSLSRKFLVILTLDKQGLLNQSDFLPFL